MDENEFMLWAGTFLETLKTYLGLFNVNPATYQTLLDCHQDLVKLRRAIGHLETTLAALYQRKNVKLYDLSPAAPPAANPGSTYTLPEENSPSAFLKMLKAEISRIKAHPGYNRTLGLALGIETPRHRNGRTRSYLSPQLDVAHDDFNVTIKWRKGDADALQLYVDHGTGELKPHTVIMRTTYRDKTPLPSENQIWRYQGICLKNDLPVGQRSPIRKIVVKQG
jgi:hypothetical protein